MLKEFYTALYTECNDVTTTCFAIFSGLKGNYANIFHIDAFNLQHILTGAVLKPYYHTFMVQIDVHSDYDQATAFALAQKMKMKLQKNYFTMANTRIVNIQFVSMIAVDEKMDGFTYKITYNYKLGN